MPCPRCVGECRCALVRGAEESTFLVDPESYDHSEEQFSQSLSAARAPLPGIALRTREAGPPDPDLPNADGWRREVSQRVTRYRSRRGYSENALSFNFEPTSDELVGAVAPPQYSSGIEPARQVPEAAAAVSEAQPDTNVIQFPRFAAVAAAPPQLAGSVEEFAPRIFEAEVTEAEVTEAETHEAETTESETTEEVEPNAEAETGDHDEAPIENDEALREDWNTSVAIATLLPSFNFDPQMAP